jgi:hypothetical protein
MCAPASRAFSENRDRQRLAALLLLELRETEGGRESRRPASYDQDVYV